MSWLIAPASTTVEDSLTGEYTVTMVGPQSTTVNPLADVARSSGSGYLAAKAIPATGTTSKFTMTVTL